MIPTRSSSATASFLAARLMQPSVDLQRFGDLRADRHRRVQRAEGSW